MTAVELLLSRAVSEASRDERARCGVDVVGLERFATALRRTPALRTRCFTQGERDAAHRDGAALGSEAEVARLAARFAAKEAAAKALGLRRHRYQAVETVTDADGAPRLHVDGAPHPAALSLAHDAGVAVAVVIHVP